MALILSIILCRAEFILPVRFLIAHKPQPTRVAE